MWSTPENDINTSALACSCVNTSCPRSYSTTQTASIVTVTASLSLFTVLGNMMVMLSISVNRHLQTINNYFLFSLAVADLVIGLVSVNLYTLYLVAGRWPLGPLLCDLWLLLDYVVSNASVMNLLVISLDRYFCVTRPLSYPARRTGAVAGLMIAGAWLLSLLLWAPPILCWQTLAARRPVLAGRCYIQLLASPPLTLGTALLSFYLPAVVMAGLYGRIAAASRSRFHVRPSPRPPARPLDRRLLDSGSSSSPRRTPQDPAGGSGETEESGSEPKPPDAQPWRRSLSRTRSLLARWPGRRRRSGVLSREGKVTHTVLAILLAFIVTWMPYNIMAVVATFCRVCVPDTLWATGYWMCYINSAINPGLYALFNVTFRRSFLRLLRCSRAPP
ncbi:unnamed protein product [Lota lota]